LFITSHLLFLTSFGKVSSPFGVLDPRFLVGLTLYLGIGCLLIVLNIMIFNWLKEILKNKLVTAEIILQILALVLILTAHLFYSDFAGKPVPQQLAMRIPYTIIIDSALFPGIGSMIIVISLILVDYMEHK
ncbi:MAG: hypothetical protein ACXAES_14305, partial [Promethearchaeota archaeon]